MTRTPAAVLSDLAAFIRGNLPVDTVVVYPTRWGTEKGRIIGRSYTAYEMADGSYVSFDQVHGRPAPASPLVAF